MVKSPASIYKPGRRGREWLKVKRAIATLDVVVTAVEVGHGKRRNLLSDYTFAVREILFPMTSSGRGRARGIGLCIGASLLFPLYLQQSTLVGSASHGYPWQGSACRTTNRN